MGWLDPEPTSDLPVTREQAQKAENLYICGWAAAGYAGLARADPDYVRYGLFTLGIYVLSICFRSLRSRVLQLRVLRLGLFVDGDVRISVLPEGEEVLICCFSFRGIVLHDISSAELQMGQCAYGIAQHNAPVVENLLELGGGFGAPMRR